MRGSVMIVGIGAGLLLLGACSWEGRDNATDETAYGQPIANVRVANSSGLVKIHAGTETKVRREMRFDGNKPGSTVEVTGDTLMINSCEQKNCEVSYDITVPS